MNRLREDLAAQEQEHRQAPYTLRKETASKLQAEQERADAALSVVREELGKLRATTTGGIRLQIDRALRVLVDVI